LSQAFGLRYNDIGGSTAMNSTMARERKNTEIIDYAFLRWKCAHDDALWAVREVEKGSRDVIGMFSDWVLLVNLVLTSWRLNGHGLRDVSSYFLKFYLSDDCPRVAADCDYGPEIMDIREARVRDIQKRLLNIENDTFNMDFLIAETMNLPWSNPANMWLAIGTALTALAMHAAARVEEDIRRNLLEEIPFPNPKSEIPDLLRIRKIGGNCGQELNRCLGYLERPRIWANEVVCPDCYRRLAEQTSNRQFRLF
jgi:hypothetical protein